MLPEFEQQAAAAASERPMVPAGAEGSLLDTLSFDVEDGTNRVDYTLADLQKKYVGKSDKSLKHFIGRNDTPEQRLRFPGFTIETARVKAELNRRAKDRQHIDPSVESSSKAWLASAKQEQAAKRGSTPQSAADSGLSVAAKRAADYSDYNTLSLNDEDDFQPQPSRQAPTRRSQQTANGVFRTGSTRGAQLQQAAISGVTPQPRVLNVPISAGDKVSGGSRPGSLKRVSSDAFYSPATGTGASTSTPAAAGGKDRCELCGKDGDVRACRLGDSAGQEMLCKSCREAMSVEPLLQQTSRVLKSTISTANILDTSLRRSQAGTSGAAHGALNLTPSQAGAAYARRDGRRSSRVAGLLPSANPQQPSGPIEISSDEEDGGGAAGPGPSSVQLAAAEQLQARRSTRSTRHVSTADKFKGCRALYPPGGGLDAVEVTAADLARLDDTEFLNDTIIDFYIKYLKDRLPPDVLARCYFFNSFFFKKICEKTKATAEQGSQGSDNGSDARNKRAYERVRKWTKGVDLFSKDFVFVPIHDALHWSLLVVCHPGADLLDGGDPRTPCMLHLDSLPGGHLTPQVTPHIRTYLQQEWDAKVEEGDPASVPVRWALAHPGQQRKFTKDTIVAQRMKPLPMQDNHCDCGLFLLTYLEYFAAELPPQFSLAGLKELQENHPYPGYLTKHWFQDVNASALRHHLRWLLLKMFLEQTEPGAEALSAVQEDIEHYEASEAVVKYQTPNAYKEHAHKADQARRKAAEEARKKRAEAEAAKAAEKQRKAEERERAKEARQAEAARRAAEAAEERAQGTCGSLEDEDLVIEVEAESQAGPDPAQAPQSSPKAEGWDHEQEQHMQTLSNRRSRKILVDDEDEAAPPSVTPQPQSADLQRFAYTGRQQEAGPSADAASREGSPAEDWSLPELLKQHYRMQTLWGDGHCPSAHNVIRQSDGAMVKSFRRNSEFVAWTQQELHQRQPAGSCSKLSLNVDADPPSGSGTMSGKEHLDLTLEPSVLTVNSQRPSGSGSGKRAANGGEPNGGSAAKKARSGGSELEGGGLAAAALALSQHRSAQPQKSCKQTSTLHTLPRPTLPAASGMFGAVTAALTPSKPVSITNPPPMPGSLASAVRAQTLWHDRCTPATAPPRLEPSGSCNAASGQLLRSAGSSPPVRRRGMSSGGKPPSLQKETLEAAAGQVAALPWAGRPSRPLQPIPPLTLGVPFIGAEGQTVVADAGPSSEPPVRATAAAIDLTDEPDAATHPGCPASSAAAAACSPPQPPTSPGGLADSLGYPSSPASSSAGCSPAAAAADLDADEAHALQLHYDMNGPSSSAPAARQLHPGGSGSAGAAGDGRRKLWGEPNGLLDDGFSDHEEPSSSSSSEADGDPDYDMGGGRRHGRQGVVGTIVDLGRQAWGTFTGSPKQKKKQKQHRKRQKGGGKRRRRSQPAPSGPSDPRQAEISEWLAPLAQSGPSRRQPDSPGPSGNSRRVTQLLNGAAVGAVEQAGRDLFGQFVDEIRRG